MHRLHEVHPGVSRGRDRRRLQADAYRDRVVVHGVRALPRALPGRLHRARAGRGAAAGGPLAHAPRGPAAPPRARRRRARPAPRRARMSPAKREELFRRLAAAIPEPKSELEFATPFELLVAVVLSAQATDKSVNLATRKLFPVATTPKAIAALGVEGLEEFIRTIGLYRGKAKNVVALSQMLLD